MRAGIVWVRPQLAHRRVFDFHMFSSEHQLPTAMLSAIRRISFFK
jgi:hypothetical protein